MGEVRTFNDAVASLDLWPNDKVGQESGGCKPNHELTSPWWKRFWNSKSLALHRTAPRVARCTSLSLLGTRTELVHLRATMSNRTRITERAYSAFRTH
jgi:hypothetical protein